VVVYFAKAPAPGQVKTRLCPPLTTHEAAGVYAAFLHRVVQPVPGARTLVYAWPPGQLDLVAAALRPDHAAVGIEIRAQQGADLWARLRTCFAELFAEGHRPVLIRNTDSPDLDPGLLTAALEHSAPGRVVLGPDQGGGYYLVALAEPHPALFTAPVAGVDTVFAETCARARAQLLEVDALPEQPDVDTFDDLLAMWRRRPG
jgi:hypothetical protein